MSKLELLDFTNTSLDSTKQGNCPSALQNPLWFYSPTDILSQIYLCTDWGSRGV